MFIFFVVDRNFHELKGTAIKLKSKYGALASLALAPLIAATANASPVEQGDFIVDFEVGLFDSDSSSPGSIDSISDNYEIGVELIYMVIDRLGLGIFVDYSVDEVDLTGPTYTVTEKDNTTAVSYTHLTLPTKA